MNQKNNARLSLATHRAKAEHSDAIIARETKRMLADFAKSLVAVIGMWLFIWLAYFAFGWW